MGRQGTCLGFWVLRPINRVFMTLGCRMREGVLLCNFPGNRDCMEENRTMRRPARGRPQTCRPWLQAHGTSSTCGAGLGCLARQKRKAKRYWDAACKAGTDLGVQLSGLGGDDSARQAVEYEFFNSCSGSPVPEVRAGPLGSARDASMIAQFGSIGRAKLSQAQPCLGLLTSRVREPILAD